MLTNNSQAFEASYGPIVVGMQIQDGEHNAIVTKVNFTAIDWICTGERYYDFDYVLIEDEDDYDIVMLSLQMEFWGEKQ